jgi:hypothetical protein
VSVELATPLPQDGLPAGARVPRKKRQHRRRPLVLVPKQAPLVRANIDGRTLAARQFSAIVDQIRADTSANGTELTVVQLAMVEAFAGLSVQLDALNTDVLLGKPVDQGAYCQLITTMVRVGSRLGVKRKPKEVGGTLLADYLDNQDRPEAIEEGERPDGTTRRPHAGSEPDDDDRGAP